MVKGLVAGVRTLTLAFFLLFAVLYVISGFATMTIGSDSRTRDLGLEEYFYNIPSAMFTAFRCFNGECVNEKGEPINYLLADAFGLPFRPRLLCLGCHLTVRVGTGRGSRESSCRDVRVFQVRVVVCCRVFSNSSFQNCIPHVVSPTYLPRSLV